MSASHTVMLSEPVSAQRSGIVCVFRPFDGGVLKTDAVTAFIPKSIIPATVCVPLARSVFLRTGTKRLHVEDDRIVGDADNTLSGSNNGVSYDSGYWVLSEVVGV